MAALPGVSALCMLVLMGCAASEENTRPVVAGRENIRQVSAPPVPPILMAAIRGELLTVKTLVEQGANVSAMSKHDMCRALDVILHNPNCTIDIVRILVDAGADVDARALSVAVCSQSPEATSIIRFLVEKGADLSSQRFFNGPLEMILRQKVLCLIGFVSPPIKGDDSVHSDFASESEGVERLRLVLGLIPNQQVKESCAKQVLVYAAEWGMLGVLEELLADYPHLAPQCLEAAREESNPNSLLTVRYLLPRLMSSSMSYLIVPQQYPDQPLKVETVEGPVAEHQGSLYELRPGTYRMRATYQRTFLLENLDRYTETGEPSTIEFYARPGYIYMARPVMHWPQGEVPARLLGEKGTWRLAAWVVYAPGESLAFPNPFIAGSERQGKEIDRYRLPLPEAEMPETWTLPTPDVNQVGPEEERPSLAEQALEVRVPDFDLLLPTLAGGGTWIGTLHVSCLGKGTVAVVRSPLVVYAGGIVVRIKATAAPGYRFKKWTGNCISDDVGDRCAAMIAVPVSGRQILQAHFVPAAEE